MSTQLKPGTVLIAVTHVIQTDPNNSQHCLTQSWKNHRNTEGRCSGINTIMDSSDLCCGMFPDPVTELELKDAEGKQASWGKGPVLRHERCLQGEKIVKVYNQSQEAKPYLADPD